MKVRPGLDRAAVRAELGPERAVALVEPQRVDGVVAGQPQAQVGPGGDEPVPHARRELGRHGELPAQLADVGHPGGPHARPGRGRRRGWSRTGRRPVPRSAVGEPPEQVARARTHHAEHGIRGGDVLDGHPPARGDVAPQPVGVAHRRGGTGHQQPLVVRDPGRRDVGLVATAGVEDAGVDRRPHGPVDVGGADAGAAGRGRRGRARAACRTTSGRTGRRPRGWRAARRRPSRARAGAPSRRWPPGRPAATPGGAM